MKDIDRLQEAYDRMTPPDDDDEPEIEKEYEDARWEYRYEHSQRYDY